MLQKYHPNPLSHFLALHNSQAAAAAHHNVVDAHTLASTIANGHVQFQQQQQQLHHHQQQQLANSSLLANHPHSQNHTTALELAAQHLNSHSSSPNHNIQLSNHHHNHLLHHQNNQRNNTQNHQLQHHQQQQQHHHNHAQQLIEAAAAANTTLDAGKSFTIAAILGLQKSAMENTRKEYTNNVINLSLNGGSNHHHQQHHPHTDNNDNLATQQPPTNGSSSTPPLSDIEDEHQHSLTPTIQQRDSLNNNNRDVSNLNVNKANICNSFNVSHNNNNNNSSNSNTTNNNNTTVNTSVNNFNCDNTNTAAAATAASVLMNRYLPSAMVSAAGGGGANVVPSAPSLVSFASSPVMAHQQHARANSFVAAAAAAAAAAAVNGAPSALQSLQQLHQQHAHQASLSFQREKLKGDHNGKKSSLKNKRVRTIFTPEQLERLEAEFERQQYMVGPERLYLAHTLQLTEAQVKVWFQNRRIKWRKHHLEITQQRLALLRQTQISNNPNGNTETATINIDTNDDECDDIKREELRELSESRQDTESELSICNDSMDAESILEGDDET